MNMTNEEVKEVLRFIEEDIDCDGCRYFPDKYHCECEDECLYITALNMAIKALEQEPKTDVLDKIRAEIDKLPDLNPDYEMDKTIHVSKWAVFDIIDKYRKE